MEPYRTLESWASRLGYVVEKTESGWVWHRENGPLQELPNAIDVVEAILSALRLEYEGGE